MRNDGNLEVDRENRGIFVNVCFCVRLFVALVCTCDLKCAAKKACTDVSFPHLIDDVKKD